MFDWNLEMASTQLLDSYGAVKQRLVSAQQLPTMSEMISQNDGDEAEVLDTRCTHTLK